MSSFEKAPDTPEPRKPEDLLDERELAFIGINRKHMNLITARMARELEWWANICFDKDNGGDIASDDDKAGTLINFQLPGGTVCTDAQYAEQLGQLDEARDASLGSYTVAIALWEEALTEPESTPQAGTWYSL